MKLASVSGIINLSKDLKKTADFYEKLGFIVASRDEDLVKVRLNWFWMDFIPKDARASGSNNQFIYISVADVDECYDQAKKDGFKPLNEPETYPSGRREFMLDDPDGYKLVFFTKKK